MTKVVTGSGGGGGGGGGGGVGRDFQDEERSQFYMEMIKTICKIHSVDINKAGFQNFGKQSELCLFQALIIVNINPYPTTIFFLSRKFCLLFYIRCIFPSALNTRFLNGSKQYEPTSDCSLFRRKKSDLFGNDQDYL